MIATRFNMKCHEVERDGCDRYKSSHFMYRRVSNIACLFRCVPLRVICWELYAERIAQVDIGNKRNNGKRVSIA